MPLSPPSPFQDVPRGNTVIALGDSTTIGNSDNALGRRAYDDWLAWAALLSDSRILYLRNAGVQGDTAALALARISADVIAYRPAVCVVLLGANDAYVSTRTVAAYIADMAAIVARLRAASIVPVLCTVPQRSDTSSALLEKYNVALRSLAERSGVFLVDAALAMRDTATGKSRTAYTLDGLHPNAAGAQVIGQAVSDVVAPMLPIWAPPIAEHAQSHSPNLVANALMETSTDGLAASWNQSGTNTPSIVTGDATILGNWQRMTVAANSEQSSLFLLTSSGWSPGDRLAISGRVSWNIASTGGAAQMSLTFFNGGESALPIYNFPNSVVTNKRFYAEMVAPAGAVNLYVFATLTAGTGGAAWMQFSQVSVLNLTTLGVTPLLAS